jgi:hypothetical protein
MPDCFGVPVVTSLRASFICTQGCGCGLHPAFPALSDFSGRQSGKARADAIARTRFAAYGSLTFEYCYGTEPSLRAEKWRATADEDGHYSFAVAL